MVTEAREMLGFLVSDDPEVLASWIASARKHYTALEQALEPLQKVVTHLERDWQPQYPAYWHRTMEHLPPLREALQTCCALFECEQSRQQCPIPIGIVGHHLQYRFSLSSVERAFEEAGILLTSHSAAPYSQEVGHIRQRQEVLKALRSLCESGLLAIIEGRGALGALPATQQAFLKSCSVSPRRRRGGVVTQIRKEGEPG